MDANKKKPSGFSSVKFTSNDAIDRMKDKDRTVEIVGYVDSLELPKIVGKAQKLTVMKFSLNNGMGKRIQCLAWQQEVKRVTEIVEINKIIHLNGAVCKEIKNSVYNTGNIPFELSIQQHTEIEQKGIYDQNVPEDIKPIRVEWKDLGNMEGKVIEISGWIQMEFKMTRHKNGTDAYAVGAITDGNYKLPINMTRFDHLSPGIKKGTPVNVTGIIEYDDTTPYLKISNGLSEKKTDEPAFDPNEMHNITCTPEKRARLE